MKRPEVNYWITNMLESYEKVSDLNFTVARPLQVETSGQLVPIDVTPEIKELTPFQTEVAALNLIQGNKRLLDDLAHHGSCDLSHTLGNRARFRVNIFTQQGHLSIVMRKMESAIPTIQSFNLPEVFNKMTNEINGFILVTGATGSGKSTTLAALCDKVNKERMVHVVTLEDPIEFVHPHKKCTFNQRELGNDFDTFANGLRAALRQAPKVILVGEMRDRETMEIGLSAAETGHLVMSTLHTVDAGQTINRILGFFDQDEQPQIRNRLTDTIRYIISQRLMPKEGGDRVAAFEIMANNLRVRDLILNGETEDRTFYDVIEDGSALGMQTFDQHILELYENGLISEETAKIYASRKSAINRGLDKIKAARGEATSGITGLAMKKKDIH
ncbi:MAG: twitching motility protein [Desulfobacterales bacterium SG8_35_2]|jgi:twitching motility protein PilT|nr:MAG: twitching motility protein [Desulfobacterales bacterium SG8_35_2]